MTGHGCHTGTFLVFPAQQYGDGACILCIAYKDRPTFHLLSRKNDRYVFNDEAMADCRTVPDLVTHLAVRQSTPSIPVKLTTLIPRGFTPPASSATGPSTAPPSPPLIDSQPSRTSPPRNDAAVATSVPAAASADTPKEEGESGPTASPKKKGILGSFRMGFGTSRRQKSKRPHRPTVLRDPDPLPASAHAVMNPGFGNFEI